MLTTERKQHIQGIVEEIYAKSCSNYSFEDFARENRIYRIRDMDIGPARDTIPALLFPISGGYALALNEQNSLEEKMNNLGHEIGHVLLDHYENVKVKKNVILNITMKFDPGSVEDTEANYFQELFYDRFSESDWIDMEKLKDFRIYKNKLQEFWHSDNRFAMALKSVVWHLRNLDV
jgi:predicted hydrocarbon binding protein